MPYIGGKLTLFLGQIKAHMKGHMVLNFCQIFDQDKRLRSCCSLQTTRGRQKCFPIIMRLGLCSILRCRFGHLPSPFTFHHERWAITCGQRNSLEITCHIVEHLNYIKIGRPNNGRVATVLGQDTQDTEDTQKDNAHIST